MSLYFHYFNNQCIKQINYAFCLAKISSLLTHGQTSILMWELLRAILNLSVRCNLGLISHHEKDMLSTIFYHFKIKYQL